MTPRFVNSATYTIGSFIIDSFEILSLIYDFMIVNASYKAYLKYTKTANTVANKFYVDIFFVSNKVSFLQE